MLYEHNFLLTLLDLTLRNDSINFKDFIDIIDFINFIYSINFRDIIDIIDFIQSYYFLYLYENKPSY